MKIALIIALATMKMYFRRSQSFFWSLFFPVVLMIGLGFYGFGEFSPSKLGIIDGAENQYSKELIKAISEKKYIKTEINTREIFDKKVLEGKIDSVLVIPDNYNHNNEVKITLEFEESKEIIAYSFEDTINSVIKIMDSENTNNDIQKLSTKIKNNSNQGYKGFLVPGIVSLAIMQSGILGVVFTLISYKSQGVLRRLQATPISSAHFLIGQLASRLLIITIQTVLLFIIGILVLNINIGQGSILAWVNILIFSLLGSVLFLIIGLAISGASPNEDYAAPIANLITFPMMFLSGVFFENDVLPYWIKIIGQNLPLSPLVTGMRESSLYGTNTLDLLPEVGLIILWIIVCFIIGIRRNKDL